MLALIEPKIFYQRFWPVSTKPHPVNIFQMKRAAFPIFCICITACTTAQLEARFEANPQCKDIVNPKTGAVMPCPGSDKAFYKSVGLEPIKTNHSDAAAIITTQNQAELPSQSTDPASETPPKQTSSTMPASECKPTLHKKTGGMLPCPSPY